MFPKKNNQITVKPQGARKQLHDLNLIEWLVGLYKMFMQLNKHTRNHVMMLTGSVFTIFAIGVMSVTGDSTPSATREKTLEILKSGAERDREIQKIIGSDVDSRKKLAKKAKIKKKPKPAKFSDKAPKKFLGRDMTTAEYIQAFSGLAVAEMHRVGVPASITLAQGILESRSGNSDLTTSTNNHFGIKCGIKGCKSNRHCANFEDDVPWDRFRRYSSAEQSYQAHSDFLKGDKKHRRYQCLFRYGRDYKRWAHGLKACGYATVWDYGTRLTRLIERNNLQKYDRY